MKKHSVHICAFDSVLVTLAVTLIGCASLDAQPDIEHASSLVTSRVQSVTNWSLPWNEPSEAWDGLSPLSSNAAVRVALQNNHEVRKQVETIVESRAEYVQAHLLPNPIINVALGFPTDGLNGDPLTASVIQQLSWLWKRPAAIDSAESSLKEQVLSVSDAALRLVAAVRTAHARVACSEDAVSFLHDNVDLLNRSADLIRKRFEVGEASQLDVNQVELQLRDAEVRLANRQTTLENAKRELLQLLGRADGETNWSALVDSSYPARMTIELGERKVMRLAISQRLDVAAAIARAESHAAEVNIEERGRIPDVRAGIGLQQNFSNRLGAFPAVEITPKLFDDNSARVFRAESKWRQATIEADRVVQSAMTEARQAWVDFQTQQEIVRSFQDEIILLAENNLTLTQDAFDAGEIDLLALLDAKQQLSVRQIEFANFKLAAATSFFELERSAGGTLETLPKVDEVAP